MVAAMIGASSIFFQRWFRFGRRGARSIWQQPPARLHLRLIEEGIVKHGLHPMAREADLAEGKIEVAPIFRIFFIVRRHREDRHGGGGAAEEMPAGRGHAGRAHFGHRAVWVGFWAPLSMSRMLLATAMAMAAEGMPVRGAPG